MILKAALTGYATAFSLILAIGAQNAFVLRQGLKREHVFIVCLICALSDAILIAAGVLGFGALVEYWPNLPKIMRIAGAAFLIGYAALRLRAAYLGSEVLTAASQAKPLLPAILTCLALTWLNPHVYLDTLGLIGAVSTNFTTTPARWAFGIAATAASFSFFFGLGYGARYLSPIMQSPKAWQIFDVAVAVLMLIIAASLLLG